MEQSFNECIDHLRNRSRLLLTQVDNNSRRIKEEYKKLYSQNLTLKENCNKGNKTSCLRGNIKSWQLRNNSSGVGGALYLNCSSDRSDHSPSSMPNLSTARRVLITSKKHSESQCCLKNVRRKPVKECYCFSEIKKAQRSTRTQHKPDTACKYCKSHIEFKPAIVKDSPEKVLSPPISCETLRKVQRIDYAPRSQFLRNVQSKVSLLHPAAAGDCPELCSRSPCCHKVVVKNKESQTDNLANSKSVSARTNLAVSDDQENPESSRKPRPKHVIKKTLTSKKYVPDISKAKSSSKASSKSKKTIQSLEKSPCCCSSKAEQASRFIPGKHNIDTEDYHHTVCVSNLDQVESNKQAVSDNELKELRKFREQNYFDTHGSSHTLHSSKSSGSLEQYVLNDRLFPELSGRIHRKDLVVTMPACATLQKKRIHYFPRYIVRQEKTNCNNKKKRCQTCPLIGHTVDLGVTKIRPPLNSLALKYQKRLP